MIPAMRRPAGVPALVPLGLLFVSASASEPDKGPSSGVEVRDSAGIEVVENLTPPDRIPVFAFLDESPRAEIGAVVDGPDQEFGFIRDAAYLDPDRIVIADEQSKEISLFSLDGALARRLGGEGDGPGEIRHLTELQTIGTDSILVWDRRAGRITLFPVDGGDPVVEPPTTAPGRSRTM